MQNKSPNHAEHVGIHGISIGCTLECSNLEVFERNYQVKRGHIMGLILGDGQKMLDIVETLGLHRTCHVSDPMVRWHQLLAICGTKDGGKCVRRVARF